MESQTNANKIVPIFISYAARDRALKKALVDHLSSLTRQKIIEILDSAQTLAGAEVEKETLRYVNDAHIIICLLSPDFLSIDHYETPLIQRMWERQEAGDVIILPILLRSVEWRSTPFQKLQVIPKNERSIKFRFNRDLVFTEVCNEIKRVVDSKRSANL